MDLVDMKTAARSSVDLVDLVDLVDMKTAARSSVDLVDLP